MKIIQMMIHGRSNTKTRKLDKEGFHKVADKIILDAIKGNIIYYLVRSKGDSIIHLSSENIAFTFSYLDEPTNDLKEFAEDTLMIMHQIHGGDYDTRI